MQILPVTDLPRLQAFHSVEAAAHDHDYVALPADPIEELLPLLASNEDTGSLVWMFLAVDDSVPVGALTLRVTTLDNLESVHVDLNVHPAHRRRGVGRRLAEAALEQVRRHGRSRVFLEVRADAEGGEAPALPLLESFGAKPVLDDVRRILDLSTHPVEAPRDAPAGYHVRQWVDRCPDDLVDGVAYLTGRMSTDPPLGQMDWEQEKWDAARFRLREASATARRRSCAATAVVEDATGAVAGFTDIGVNQGAPTVAYQWETIVDPPHRGHRLGLVLKSWNHQLLVERFPQVRYVNTWNAASNTFMISVNEALGFVPIDLWTEWQLDL